MPRRRTGVFAIELLPAGHGDCIWIEYGDPDNPRRIVIDAGPEKAYKPLVSRVERLAKSDRHFELFVMTHIDGDHIGGAIPFFKNEELGVTFEDIWFNGWKHMPRRRLGGRQAEIFSTILRDRELRWNHQQGGEAVMLIGDELPRFTLAGGMRLTLLSPGHRQLWQLRAVWEKEVRRHGLAPGSKRQYRKFLAKQPTRSKNVPALAASRFRNDGSKPNAASIAFLAEYGGRSVLFTGDAHAPILIDSLQQLLNGRDRLRIDALKVSHHGSRANTNAELIRLLDCPRYLISTDGSYFNHPDREAIARIIHNTEQPELFFNAVSRENEVWGEDDLQDKYGFSAEFPKNEAAGIRLEI